MIGFRYLPPALEEMAESAIFYEDQSPGLGAEYLDDVQRIVKRLRENPKLGHPLVKDLRRGLLTRFPYSIIYSIESEFILVIAVAHQRRHPYYWRERIER